jgi:hypothetical protein
MRLGSGSTGMPVQPAGLTNWATWKIGYRRSFTAAESRAPSALPAAIAVATFIT